MSPPFALNALIGLYLHIPFCRSKCPYCDFFSLADRARDFRIYPNWLCQHLHWAADHGWKGPVSTVYFGGGTPSLLSPQSIAQLLGVIDLRYGLIADAEVTLEVNPGTVSAATLSGYRSAGVNRLSLGLQSLESKHLSTLERRHGRREGVKAVHLARQAGFDNLSLDLMFALPGQSLSGLEVELDRYLEFSPEHLSCYGLTAEPGTRFYDDVRCGKVNLPDDTFYAEAFRLLHERLSDAGFQHYEIANYARPGYVCRHNLNYWQRRPYLGIGAGAHSFLDNAWGERWAVPNDIAAYEDNLRRQQEPARHLESFNRQEAMSETVYLALRTSLGIEDKLFVSRYGKELSEVFPAAVKQLGAYLHHIDGRWQLTLEGWLLYDRLIQEFL